MKSVFTKNEYQLKLIVACRGTIERGCCLVQVDINSSLPAEEGCRGAAHLIKSEFVAVSVYKLHWQLDTLLHI